MQPVIPTPRNLRQEDFEFKASLGLHSKLSETLSQKKKEKKKKNRKGW
jgi:hypothetical protein